MTTAAELTNCKTAFTSRMATATTAFGAQGHDRDICREQGLILLKADMAALFERDYKAAGLQSPTPQNLTKCRTIFDQHMTASGTAFSNATGDRMMAEAQASGAFQKFVGIVLGS